MLLLAPSAGFGGGIERVARAIEDAWEGRVERVDLYRAGKVANAAGRPQTKAGFAARAGALAIRSRPGIVLALHAGLLPVAHAAARLTGSDVAVMGIGLEVWGPMSERRRAAVARCARVLAISEFTAVQLARRAGVDRRRVRVVQLPVAPWFARAAATPRAAHGSNRLLTVSRLVSENRYKGHFDVLESLPAVLARHPGARWVVVGEGDDLPVLKAACESRSLDGAVELRGAVDDAGLAAAYEEAAFVVLPSVADPNARPPTGEGFGLVYAEAACFGLPAIASTAGGGSLDFVEHEVTGLTTPPGDPAALAGAMTRLLDDPDLARRLGEHARERVLERHLPPHFQAALRAALVDPV
jgi:phosphatidylinositol alpha-1,6-mannosyltransferase